MDKLGVSSLPPPGELHPGNWDLSLLRMLNPRNCKCQRATSAYTARKSHFDMWTGDSRVQQYYSGGGHPCMYVPRQQWSVKMNFLVNTGCIHNLSSKATFDRLPAAVKERPELWDTTATLADDSGLPTYGKIELAERLRNFPFTIEFLVSRLLDQRILKMAFLTDQRCE